MGVLILTLLGGLFIGGALWLLLGSRFNFDQDQEVNDLINFVLFFCGALPLSFVLVFFGIGG
ncbi:MAG: hypothetical protein AAF529_09375 [Pseudomonadota bacterium]